jgi:hypothetical protein
MHIEKKSLKTAPTAKSNPQFRVDLSKPAPDRAAVWCVFWCMLVCVVLAV